MSSAGERQPRVLSWPQLHRHSTVVSVQHLLRWQKSTALYMTCWMFRHEGLRSYQGTEAVARVLRESLKARQCVMGLGSYEPIYIFHTLGFLSGIVVTGLENKCSCTSMSLFLHAKSEGTALVIT